jgi:glycosyltransferase involved in cell wall biosynthesis
MKILLLIDSLVSGGRERRLIELIKGLRNHSDVQLKLVVFSDKIYYEEIYELDVPIIILKRIPKKNPLVFYKLYKICRDWRPDLMHSWGTMSAIWAIPSTILLNIKLINGNVTNAPDNMGFFDKELVRAKFSFPFSKFIIGNSKAGLSAYKVPKKKGICIYNGFDFNRINDLKDKASIRNQFNILTTKVVGMVAGFFERKDYETYLKAAFLVLKHRTDVTFMAIGEGPSLMKYKEIIPLDYKSYFKFTGVQKDVESIINIFDIGVLSTNTKVHGEGISNAILEYMALEKPVVATTGGGTNEIVENLKTGFLIPPDSPEVMAIKLNYLLDNPTEALRMGTDGKNRISKMFSLVEMTNSYYKLYQKVLDQNNQVDKKHKRTTV